MPALTHAQLVDRAERWLRNTHNCRVVLCELEAFTRYGEIPDVVAWIYGESILVECKVSRRDFAVDQKKPFRRSDINAVPGIGSWRLYLTPTGLLDGMEIPDGWGWYETDGKKIVHRAGWRLPDPGCTRRPLPPNKTDLASEVALLSSALARCGGGRTLKPKR